MIKHLHMAAGMPDRPLSKDREVDGWETSQSVGSYDVCRME
jgi:hypothetical protein